MKTATDTSSPALVAHSTRATGSTSYPEHDKLKAISELSQAQHDFIEWLNERGIELAEYDNNDRLWPTTRPLQKLLAEHHGIDLVKLENEKRAMLAQFSRSNTPVRDGAKPRSL